MKAKLGGSNAELAGRIVAAFKEKGLLGEGQWKAIEAGLAQGTLKREDWQRFVEQVLDKDSRSEPES